LLFSKRKKGGQVDSSFWFPHLVSTIATGAILAITTALATRLLAVATALATLDQVTHCRIEVSRNTAANAVNTTRRDAYDTLGGICNRTHGVRRGHRRVSKGAPETTY
jgi:hypothetical protein